MKRYFEDLYQSAKEVLASLEKLSAPPAQRKPYTKEITLSDKDLILVAGRAGKKLAKVLTKLRSVRERVRALKDIEDTLKKSISDMLENMEVGIAPEGMTLEDALRLLEEKEGKIGSLEKIVVMAVGNTEEAVELTRSIKFSIETRKALLEYKEKIKEILSDENLKTIEEKADALYNALLDYVKMTEEIKQTVRAVSNKLKKELREQGIILEESIEKEGVDIKGIWEKVKAFFSNLYNAIKRWFTKADEVMEYAEDYNVSIESLVSELSTVVI